MNEKQNEKQKLKSNEKPKKITNVMGKINNNKKAGPGLGIEPGSLAPTCPMTCAQVLV